MLLDQPRDFLRVLVGDQAGRKLRVGLGRNYRLRAFPGVTTPDAVQLQSRPAPHPLDNRIALFTAQLRRPDGLAKLFLLPGQGIERLSFGTGERGDVVVEARDVDAKVLIDRKS